MSIPRLSLSVRITDEGALPEMCIWSTLLIKSDLKWCIHLSRSLCQHLRNQSIQIFDEIDLE